METFTVTKEHLNNNNEYIGKTDLADYNGNLKIDSDLGWVKFKSINISGWTQALAGSGIEAGWFVSCKLTLSSGLRIFAGLCLWRLPEKSETEIRCGKVVKGEICYGELIETGLPEEKLDGISSRSE